MLSGPFYQASATKRIGQEALPVTCPSSTTGQIEPGHANDHMSAKSRITPETSVPAQCQSKASNPVRRSIRTRTVQSKVENRTPPCLSSRSKLAY